MGIADIMNDCVVVDYLSIFSLPDVEDGLKLTQEAILHILGRESK